MGFHLKFFYNTTLRPIYLLILWYFRLSLSFFYTRKRGGERVTTEREMRPQLIFLTGPPFQEWNGHKRKIPRDRDCWPEQINKLSGAREIARTRNNYTNLAGYKRKGPRYNGRSVTNWENHSQQHTIWHHLEVKKNDELSTSCPA